MDFAFDGRDEPKVTPRSDHWSGCQVQYGQRLIDDSLSQSGGAGRRGQRGDRCKSVRTALNIVKVRHTPTQGKWEREAEGERKCCWCASGIGSTLLSDQPKAGQMNGCHPTLKRIKVCTAIQRNKLRIWTFCCLIQTHKVHTSDSTYRQCKAVPVSFRHCEQMTYISKTETAKKDAGQG